MPLYCSFRRISGEGRKDVSHDPITAEHNQWYPIIWRHCLLSRDFPPFFLSYPPPNTPHSLGGLLKLNGLKGADDPRCNLSCWCCCWTMFFCILILLNYTLYTIYLLFNVVFCNIGIVLFLYYEFFSHPIFWGYPLPSQRKRPCLI